MTHSGETLFGCGDAGCSTQAAMLPQQRSPVWALSRIVRCVLPYSNMLYLDTSAHAELYHYNYQQPCAPESWSMSLKRLVGGMVM
jgi:hypothetical protein